MTAKEYLRQAYFLDQRINSDIAEVERLRLMLSGISASGFEERYDKNRPIDAPFVRSLEKIWELEKKIDDEIDSLVDLKAQIRDVIESVPDPNERIVLRYRYVNNRTWEQIGDALHADRTTVYRWYSRAIRHVKLPENPIIV